MTAERKKVKSTKFIIVIFVIALAAFSVFAAFRILDIQETHKRDISRLKHEFDSVLSERQLTGYSRVFQSVAPFTYQIKASQLVFKNKYSFKDFFSGENEALDTIYTTSYGSGICLEFKGNNYMVTARHNVLGAHRIEVLTSAGGVFDADLVREDSVADIAILTFQGIDNAESYRAGKDKIERELVIGQPVFAVGFPFGNTQFSYTGVIGGFVSDASGLDQFVVGRTVSPGMSGSGVFNYNGELIGIILKSGKTKAEAYTSALSIKEFSRLLLLNNSIQ